MVMTVETKATKYVGYEDHPLSFAGLWEHWQSEEGSEIIEDSVAVKVLAPVREEYL